MNEREENKDFIDIYKTMCLIICKYIAMVFLLRFECLDKKKLTFFLHFVQYLA